MLMTASAVRRQLIPPAGTSVSGADSGGAGFCADDSLTASSLRGGKTGRGRLFRSDAEHDGAVRRHFCRELTIERSDILLLPEIANDSRAGDAKLLPGDGHFHRLE